MHKVSNKFLYFFLAMSSLAYCDPLVPPVPPSLSGSLPPRPTPYQQSPERITQWEKELKQAAQLPNITCRQFMESIDDKLKILAASQYGGYIVGYIDGFNKLLPSEKRIESSAYSNFLDKCDSDPSQTLQQALESAIGKKRKQERLGPPPAPPDL